MHKCAFSSVHGCVEAVVYTEQLCGPVVMTHKYASLVLFVCRETQLKQCTYVKLCRIKSSSSSSSISSSSNRIASTSINSTGSGSSSESSGSEHK
jgi:hypothetical protein